MSQQSFPTPEPITRAAPSARRRAAVLTPPAEPTAEVERERLPVLSAWQALLAALPMAAVIADAAHQIILINHAAEELLGEEGASPLGRPLTELTSHIATALDLPEATARDLRALLACTDQAAERALTTPGDSGRQWASLTPLAFTSESSPQPYHLLLLRAQDSRSAASAPPLDAVVRPLSHSLVDSLAAIQNALPALEPAAHGADLATQRHTLHQIGEQAEEMRAALAALGGLYELRAGTSVLQTAPVELSDLLMSIAAQWKPRAPEHTFELALKGVEPRIIADEQWVERAMTMLLEHAVKMAARGGSIHIGLRARREELIVSVRQEARAVSAEQLSRLFEPCARIEGCDDVVVGGGLGLALARASAEAHGGRAWAELPEGSVGMTLLLAFPLVPPGRMPGEADSSHSAPVEVIPPLRERLPVERPRQVVLVAHADPPLARYLRANLEEQSFRALAAGELAELWRLIELEEPDLILVESELPGLGGADALQRLRAQARVPVIVLARRHDSRDCARALNQGASDYIAQPFSTEELVARVRAALRATPPSSRAEPLEPFFQSGDLAIDYAQRAVSVAGHPISLSKTEFKLLRALAHHAGMVLSHESLLERVWGPGYQHEVEFVWVYIRRLRRKIEPDPAHPHFILTVPGVGYRLVRE